VHPLRFPFLIRLAHGAYRHKLGSEIERVNSLVPLERHGLSTSLPLVPHQSFIALLKNALHPGDTEMRTTLTISQSCAPSLLAWSITSCSLPAAITLYSHRETSYVSGAFDRLRATIWLRDRPLAEPVTVMGNVPLGMFDAAERSQPTRFVLHRSRFSLFGVLLLRLGSMDGTEERINQNHDSRHTECCIGLLQ
jgi:hypothetical protein